MRYVIIGAIIAIAITAIVATTRSAHAFEGYTRADCEHDQRVADEDMRARTNSAQQARLWNEQRDPSFQRGIRYWRHAEGIDRLERERKHRERSL